MSDLLERTTPRTDVLERGPAPPSTPQSPPVGPARWPRRARILIAVLAIATLFAAAGAVYAVVSDDTPATTLDQAEIDDLLDQRDALILERQRLQSELDDTTALADESATARIELEGQLAAAEGAISGLENDLVVAADESAALDERITELRTDVAALLSRAVSAEAERDALAELFPLSVDTSLEPTDVIGDWDLTWVRHYGEGFTAAFPDPGFDQITITSTPASTLQVDVPGQFTAGLARADGGLVAFGQSARVVPACDGVPRIADVTLTLYGVDVTVEADGSDSIDHLGSTVVVSAPATGTCPAGIAAFGATLAP